MHILTALVGARSVPAASGRTRHAPDEKGVRSETFRSTQAESQAQGTYVRRAPRARAAR